MGTTRFHETLLEFWPVSRLDVFLRRAIVSGANETLLSVARSKFVGRRNLRKVSGEYCGWSPSAWVSPIVYRQVQLRSPVWRRYVRCSMRMYCIYTHTQARVSAPYKLKNRKTKNPCNGDENKIPNPVTLVSSIVYSSNLPTSENTILQTANCTIREKSILPAHILAC